MSSIDGELNILPTIAINGAHVPAKAAVVKAASPAGSAFTFTAKYSHSYRGIMLVFRKGQTVSLPAEVAAALQAANAPMAAA